MRPKSKIIRMYWEMRRYWLRLQEYQRRRFELCVRARLCSDIFLYRHIEKAQERIEAAEEVLDRLYPRWRDQVETDKLRQELAEYHAQDLRLLQRRLRTHILLKETYREPLYPDFITREINL